VVDNNKTSPDPSELLSLWLVPDEPMRSALQSLIKDASEATGKESFVPHVTVLGDLLIDFDGLDRITREVARLSPVMNLALDGPVLGQTFFQSFFAPVKPDARLSGLYNTLADQVASNLPWAQYYPHLSIAYGEVPAHHRAPLRAMAENLLPAICRFSRLSIVHSNQNLAPCEWKILSEIDLQG